MKTYGLIGFPLTHSFSAGYFAQKFKNENIRDMEYRNFPLSDISQFENLVKETPGLVGLNVTIPYKEKVIPFLHELDKTAKEVNAVNTIKFIQNYDGELILKGYNTDVFGFEQTIQPYLECCHRKALILGTGGASKAVEFVLRKHGLHCFYISRHEGEDIFKTYGELTGDDLLDFHIIVNTTPLGMFPKTEECPPIPYDGITDKHILFDLIYNPEETLFLSKGKTKGAKIINGLEMLHQQAEKAWQIWNS